LAKIVLVCLRNPSPEASARVQARLKDFIDSLCPDHLVPAVPILATDGQGLHVGVFNPAEPAAIHGCSAYAGWLQDAVQAWWRPGTPAPTGSFALLRGNASTVEALADFAASRTVWIAQTDEIFIASTTQRAIPHFLGSFETNPQAIAWMLSAGTLGPFAGWDRRARPLAPGGLARLDRLRWSLSIREPSDRVLRGSCTGSHARGPSLAIARRNAREPRPRFLALGVAAVRGIPTAAPSCC